MSRPKKKGPTITLGYCHKEFDSVFASTSLLMETIYNKELITGAVAIYSGPKVDEARNEIMERWLTETNSSHLFMWDTDIVIQPHTIRKLLAHNLDIVCGLYFTSPTTGEVIPQIRTLVQTDEGQIVTPVWDYEPNSLIPVVGAGAGMMLISRKAANAVWHARGKDHPLPWFAHGVHNGVRIGEDIAFCLTAIKCGFDVWCDTGVVGRHHKPNLVDELDYVRSLSMESHPRYDQRNELPIYQKYLGEDNASSGQ